MSASVTAAQVQEKIDALMACQAAGGLLSISIHGRTTTFASLAELQKQIDYWIRFKEGMNRKAAGLSRHGYSVADFRSTR